MAIHTFQPQQYFNTFGSHAPVLRIAPGDTVVTTTIDAGGVNAAGERLCDGPNPQTGPFYIEGAEVGDTLVVRIEQLTTNRGWGYSASVLAANTVDPERVRDLPARERLTWRIDRQRQKASLDAQAGPGLPRIDALEWDVEPMLGCLGVAPAGGQAISSATSGNHGGNMDYRQFRPGVTAYFPVFVPGALFFLGDGHALQGDGEIVGTGIETTFDVRFTAVLQKGRRIQWPRGEDAQFIFTIGNARPLDQAVQHATTEMLDWLTADYGLDVRAASTLLGMYVRYDLGNMFDPAYTMVCKLPKAVLERLAG